MSCWLLAIGCWLKKCIDCRNRAFLWRLAKWPEKNIGKRIEPTMHGNHIAVNDTRIGEIDTSVFNFF